MAKKIGIQLRGSGRALRPSGPGVIRPKPQDRYGQPFKPKPIRPGKKDGGKIVGDYVEKKRSEFKSKRKGLTLEKAKKAREEIQMDRFKKKRKEQRDKPKTPLGGKMKKPKPGSYDYQLQETMKPDYKKRKAMKKGGFPDLSGDGKVTKKDILMGRGIIPRKLKDLKPGTVDTAKKIIKKGKK